MNVVNYEYKSIPFNATISITNDYSEVALMYEDIINKHAVNGWELYLIDQVTAHKPQGCFTPAELVEIKIAIFRRKLI